MTIVRNPQPSLRSQTITIRYEENYEDEYRLGYNRKRRLSERRGLPVMVVFQ